MVESQLKSGMFFGVCADCDKKASPSKMMMYSYKKIKAKGEAYGKYERRHWWICEDCAVDRGWVW